MKKIAIDARMINHSGIGTVIKNILPHLSRFASDYELILLGDSSALKNFANIGRCIYANYPIYSIKEQILIPKILNKEKVSLYYATHYNIPLLYRGKIVATIHDLIHLLYPEHLPFGKLGYAYARFMLQQAVTKSARIITISENTRKDIIHILKAEEKKISVIYPGVSSEKFSPRKDNSNPDKKDAYILSVGVIRPHKNTLSLIDAFHKFTSQTKTNFKLILVGWGKPPYIDMVKRKVSELYLKDKVEFVEKTDTDKLAEFYRNAFMFVFPSLYEGFGLPPLEAMASGCPVISSNRASLPEVVGDAALMVNPENVNEIAEAMKKLYSDEILRNNLIQKGLRRASLFKWQETAKQICKIWEEVLEE